MRLARAMRHLFTPDWVALRPFSHGVLDRVEQAIRASERLHSGELRFAIEAAMEPLDILRGRSSRDRARELFSLLSVWDTEENSGVLIYLQMVERRIEIVADRGINRRVAQPEWDAICRRMEAAFRDGRFERGSIAAIEEITALLARHFPPGEHNPDELPDRPVIVV